MHEPNLFTQRHRPTTLASRGQRNIICFCFCFDCLHTLHHLTSLHLLHRIPSVPHSALSHLSLHTTCMAAAATEANVKVATHANEPPSTSNCDPFVDDTKPRHDRGSLAALMAAIQQVSKCLLAFTWCFPAILPPSQSSFIPLTATIFDITHHCMHLYGSLQLLPRVRHGRSASPVHTFTGCPDSACSTAVSRDGSQIQKHNPQPCATSRTMHPHHHDSAAWRQHMSNVWQSSKHRLALRLPPGLAS